MATVYDLTLDQLTERLGDWGEPPFRAKQIHRQLWHRAATYDRMPDVPKRLRERLEAELPIGVDVLEERDGGPGRDPEGAAADRRPARDRDRADGLPGPGHGVRLDADRVRDGLRVLRDRADGAPQQPHRRRDRGAGGVGPAGGRRAAGVDPPAPVERRLHGDGRAAVERATHVRRARAAHRRDGDGGPARHGLDRRRRAGDPPARRGVPAGRARRQPARRRRRPAQRARPGQPAVAARRADRRDRGVAPASRAAGPRSSGR